MIRGRVEPVRLASLFGPRNGDFRRPWEIAGRADEVAMAVEEVQEQGLNLSDVLAVARRRAVWLGAPIVIGLVLALIAVLVLPREYESAATIVAESEEIPDEIAHTTVTATAEELWENLRVEILARDSLSPIIDDYQLFRGNGASREELVDNMRERIAIEPLPPAIVDPRKPVELNSFRIAFRWPVPEEASGVANRLTRDFISAHLKQRSKRAEGASEFIAQELNKTRAELQRVGQEITDYKENFQGELPEQLQLNREHLQRSQVALATNEAMLETAREQVLQIRREIEAMIRAATGSADQDPVVRKQALELHLNHLLSTGKTEKHPSVIRTRAEVAALEVVIESHADDPGPSSPDVVKLRHELRGYEVQAQVHAGEIERLKADIAEYEQRIENTPRRAAELAHMESSYENLALGAAELQRKKLETDMARSIELSNKGETFRIVESAVPADSPVSPNIPLLLVAGLALGAMTGLALAVVRELMDASFHTVADLQRVLGLPVLATVPMIELPAERARRRRAFWRRGGAAAGVMLLLLAGLAFYRLAPGAIDGAREALFAPEAREPGASDV